ncbi:MAG: hypothetical protein ABIF82_13135 [Planctomycetota bacterium]
MPELERKKTGGLTALGVLSVVLGGIFFITSVWSLLQPQVHMALVAKHNAPQLLTGYGLAGAYASGAANLLLAVLLFAAGVGLLKLRKWGAASAVWYAIVRIAWSVVSAVLAFAGPFAAKVDLEKLHPDNAEYMQNTFPAVATTLIIAGLVLSSLFAVILLCLLSRQSYKDNLT